MHVQNSGLSGYLWQNFGTTPHSTLHYSTRHLKFYMGTNHDTLASPIVDTIFLTRVKEGDFNEGKVTDLKETKRYTGLESADGARPMDQRTMF